MKNYSKLIYLKHLTPVLNGSQSEHLLAVGTASR